ncbi:putative peroxisomal membrane protein PEX13 [Aphelenchoides bicaudatus]|nr:putative peroxisomal membrane protein PEX13 [Aphelenchoides bicaudatus]
MATPPNGDSAPPPIPPPPAMNSNMYGPTSSYGVDPYASSFGTSSFMQPTFGSPYGMSGYNSYNSFGNGMYGNGMYGQYGGMFGAGGMGQSPESNFVRLAEESSRNAFQSIEAVVSAVASVANMLNSTHNAVFSSFRAVIGVVEQFSILKKQMSAVVTFTIIRWLKHFWRRLMVHLGLKPANYAMSSDAWSDATTGAAPPSLGISWPAMIFWLVALGGPYLIYKCVSQMVRSIEEKRKWATGASQHHNSVALYDFQARNQQELTFRQGDRLRVAPRDEQPKIHGWVLASSANGEQIGLAPISYLKVIKTTSATPPRSESPASLTPPGAMTPANPASNQAASRNFEAAFGR